MSFFRGDDGGILGSWRRLRSVTRPRFSLTLVAAQGLLCLTTGLCRGGERDRWIQHGFSQCGSYVVRVSADVARESRTHVDLLRYDRQSADYVLHAQKELNELPAGHAPLEIAVSSNGRYVAGLGKRGADLYDLKQALWIWDCKRNVLRHFAVTDFMSATQIDRYVANVPMAGGGLWFSGEPVFDPSGSKLFVTPNFDINPASDERELIDRDRFVAILERPTVVVDFTSMSVRTVERSQLCGWKRRLDEITIRTDLAFELQEYYMTPRADTLLTLVRRTVRPPQVEFAVSNPRRRIRRPWLCRLDPGVGGKRARVTVFRYSAADHSYRLERVVSLANRVAPCDWVVSLNAAYIATFDEIDSIGTGDNVVAIYNVEAQQMKTFRLEDFLTNDWLQKMESEHPGRMRLWRGGILNIIIQGQGFTEWERRARRSRLDWFPRVVVDLENMSVKMLDRSE